MGFLSYGWRLAGMLIVPPPGVARGGLLDGARRSVGIPTMSLPGPASGGCPPGLPPGVTRGCLLTGLSRAVDIPTWNGPGRVVWLVG
jgi:hypothetical protein